MAQYLVTMELLEGRAREEIVNQLGPGESKVSFADWDLVWFVTNDKNRGEWEIDDMALCVKFDDNGVCIEAKILYN